MLNIALLLMQQLNTAVFVLLTILVLAFCLTYKIGGVVNKFKGVEKKTDKFDSSIDSIKDNLSKIGATTELLYKAHLSTIASRSPLDLTGKGQEISKAIFLESKVDQHWDAINKELQKMHSINPYDIQNAAMELAKNCFDAIFTEKERDQIKTYAFQIGIDLLEIYPIIGIIIRNKYLGNKMSV